MIPYPSLIPLNTMHSKKPENFSMNTALILRLNFT